MVDVRILDGAINLIYEWTGTDGPDVITGFRDGINWVSGEGGDDLISLNRITGGSRGLGGPGDDTIKGGLGYDQLNGGPGADLLMGGPGGDSYVVDDPGDVIVERARWNRENQTDRVISEIDFDLTGLAVENLFLDGAAIVGTGNDLRNRITGTFGDNILDGGRNVDTLVGGSGDDTYLLRTPGDEAHETLGNTTPTQLSFMGHDTVLAFGSFGLNRGIEDIFIQDMIGKTGQPVQGLTAIGNTLANRVVGNAYDNNLNGLGGADTLEGGAGADSFIFTTNLVGDNVDTIVDFVSGEDRIVLRATRVPGLDLEGVSALAETALGLQAQLLFSPDGMLSFDPDGEGADQAINIARLGEGTALSINDLVVL